MKRVFLILVLGLFAVSSYSQKIQRNSCSCYNFLSDDEVQYIKDSIIYYNWNEENGLWSEAHFGAYYYNEYFKIKEHLIYIVRPEEDSRTRLNRYEYEYSKEERSMIRNGYLWNEEWVRWQETTLAKYQYDSTLTMSERVDSYWDQSTQEWVFNYDFKTRNSFSEDGPDYQRFKWSGDLQTWGKDTETYCSDRYEDNRKVCTTYTWNEDLTKWAPTTLATHYYDRDGSLQKRTVENWDEELLSWQPIHLYFYLYDKSGKEIEWLSFGWDKDTGERKGLGRQLYTYDAGGNRYETFRYNWSKEKRDWRLYAKQVDYWRDLVKSTVDEIVGDGIKIYPNPFEEYATIEFGDYQNTHRIELIDMFGRKVRIVSEISGPLLILDRVNLQSGLYLLKIYTTTGAFTKRVIIE